MFRGRRFLTVWACQLAFGGSAVLADSEPLRAHLSRARMHFDLGEYQEAERALRDAYQIDARPEILYAIAQAQRLGGDCVKARESYRAYMRGELTAEQRRLAEQNLALCANVADPPSPTVEPPVEIETEVVTAPNAPSTLAYALTYGGIVLGALGLGVTAYAGLRIWDADRPTEYDAYLDWRETRLGRQRLAWGGVLSVIAGGAATTAGIVLWRGRGRHVVTSPAVDATTARVVVSCTF